MKKSSIRIASFNVNSIRARLPVLSRWLRESGPDILCVQETKAPDDRFPDGELKDYGYETVFRGEKSYNGVAIFSKTPVEKYYCGFDGEGEDEGSRLITAWINGIIIVNTYIPQGYDPESEKFAYKLNWLERLKSYFLENFENTDRLIWLGDFNIAPEPIDVHDPKRLLGHVCYHPKVHEALFRIKEWGFIDVFRKHKPEPEQYTFWDYRVRNAVKNKVGWRVDHIWATKSMAENSTKAWIDIKPRLWEKPSDHTPIIAEFKLS